MQEVGLVGLEPTKVYDQGVYSARRLPLRSQPQNRKVPLAGVEPAQSRNLGITPGLASPWMTRFPSPGPPEGSVLLQPCGASPT